MSGITSISVSEYLRSSYSPDRDFVDGRVEERNLGEHDHAAVQAALVLWFGQRQDEWNIEVLPNSESAFLQQNFAYLMFAWSRLTNRWNRYSPNRRGMY